MKLEVGTLSEVVSVVAEGTDDRDEEQRLLGAADGEADRADPDRGPRRRHLLRLLPGVRYENDIEAMGDSFGSQIPNIGGMRSTGTR